MKVNRLTTFTLGVITTAACLGIVSFASAASEPTVKACASKSNGVMRYLAKGTCKKSEKLLTWNQVGLSGLSGTAGTKGETGSKGESGSSGVNGSNGQNYFLVGNDGKTIGPVMGVDASTATVLFNGSLFNVNLADGSMMGGLNVGGWYSDSNCLLPFAIQQALTNSLMVGVDYQVVGGITAPKFFKLSGGPATLASQGTVYVKSGLRCVVMDASNRTGFASSIIYSTVETTGPQIVLPLSIASR